LRGEDSWGCVFLDLRLYLLMLVEEVCWSIIFFPLSIFIVLVVCSAGVAVVGVVGVHGFMVWAMCHLCCVFCRFVWFCSRLWYSSSVPPALYRLLYGSGSSLFRGSDRYVVGLSIHGVISPVSTYRRFMRDNWSACR
jgi:hypothetical protein